MMRLPSNSANHRQLTSSRVYPDLCLLRFIFFKGIMYHRKFYEFLNQTFRLCFAIRVRMTEWNSTAGQYNMKSKFYLNGGIVVVVKLIFESLSVLGRLGV